VKSVTTRITPSRCSTTVAATLAPPSARAMSAAGSGLFTVRRVVSAAGEVSFLNP
jgi:hypothetical protein